MAKVNIVQYSDVDAVDSALPNQGAVLPQWHAGIRTPPEHVHPPTMIR